MVGVDDDVVRAAADGRDVLLRLRLRGARPLPDAAARHGHQAAPPPAHVPAGPAPGAAPVQRLPGVSSPANLLTLSYLS